MSLLQESVAGHVTVLWTDLTEPEALVERLAEQAFQKHPERFRGQTALRLLPGALCAALRAVP